MSSQSTNQAGSSTEASESLKKEIFKVLMTAFTAACTTLTITFPNKESDTAVKALNDLMTAFETDNITDPSVSPTDVIAASQKALGGLDKALSTHAPNSLDDHSKCCPNCLEHEELQDNNFSMHAELCDRINKDGGLCSTTLVPKWDLTATVVLDVYFTLHTHLSSIVDGTSLP